MDGKAVVAVRCAGQYTVLEDASLMQAEEKGSPGDHAEHDHHICEQEENCFPVRFAQHVIGFCASTTRTRDARSHSLYFQVSERQTELGTLLDDPGATLQRASVALPQIEGRRKDGGQKGRQRHRHEMSRRDIPASRFGSVPPASEVSG